MAEQKVNKKLLIGCGIALVFAGIVFFLPTDTNFNVPKDTSTSVEVPNTSNSNSSDLVVVEEKPEVVIPNSSNFNIKDLNKYVSLTYSYSLEEVLNAKNSGIYNTYKDNSDYVANPYHQKYSFSKESGLTKVDISQYEQSFYGSLGNHEDFNSSFPSGDTQTQTQNTSNNENTNKEDNQENENKEVQENNKNKEDNNN